MEDNWIAQLKPGPEKGKSRIYFKHDSQSIDTQGV